MWTWIVVWLAIAGLIVAVMTSDRRS